MGAASPSRFGMPSLNVLRLAVSASSAVAPVAAVCGTACSWALAPLTWTAGQVTGAFRGRSGGGRAASANGGRAGGHQTTARRVLGTAFLGFLAGEALQGAATVGALGCFWLFYWLCVPTTTHAFPIFLEYPHMRPSLPEPSGADADAALPWPSLPAGPGRGASEVPETLGSSSASGRSASGAAASSGWAPGAEEAALSACANVSLEGHWSRFAHIDMDLALTLPPLPDSWALWPSMCSVRLFDRRGREVVSSARPLLLPHKHWAVRLWSATLWGPFIALGLASSDRDAVALPLLESASGRPAASTAATARLCLTPGLPTYSAELRLHVRLRGPLRLVQAYPKLCSVVIAVCAAVVSWAATGGLLLGYLLRSPGGQEVRAEASTAVGQAKAFTTHLMEDVLSGDDAPRRLPLDQHSTTSSEATTPHLGLASPSRERALTGVISDLAVAAREAAADRKLQASAASAAGGAVVLGTGGAATGMIAGGAVGAACGVVPAFFTFGLSIPVGAAIGGGAGAMMLSAVGSSLGFLGGGALGYGISSHLEGKEGPAAAKAAGAQAKATCPPISGMDEIDRPGGSAPMTSPLPTLERSAGGGGLQLTARGALAAHGQRSPVATELSGALG